jgi:hypothetical protein
MALDKITGEAPSPHPHEVHNLYDRVMPRFNHHVDKTASRHGAPADPREKPGTESARAANSAAGGAHDKPAVSRATGTDSVPTPVLPTGSAPVENPTGPTQTKPPESVPAPTPPFGPPTEKPPTPKPPSGPPTEGGNQPNPGNPNHSPYSPPAFLDLPQPPHGHRAKHQDTPPPVILVPPPVVAPPKPEQPVPSRPNRPEVPVVPPLPPVVPPLQVVPPPVVPVPPLQTTTVPPRDVPQPPHVVIPPRETIPPKAPVHPKIPTNVFTGQGPWRSQEVMDKKYAAIYGDGKQGHGAFVHLIADQLGIKSGPHKGPLVLDIEPVGTGKDQGLKKHQTEMVAPRDPKHVGVWKYSDADLTGKTIVVGHVVWNRTPGPFYDLHELGVHNGRPDLVRLQDMHGRNTTYQFSKSEVVKNPSDQKVWNRVFGPGDPKQRELELITCAGPVVHGVHQWRLIDHLTEVKTADKAAQASNRKTVADSGQIRPGDEVVPKTSSLAVSPDEASAQPSWKAPFIVSPGDTGESSSSAARPKAAMDTGKTSTTVPGNPVLAEKREDAVVSAISAPTQAAADSAAAKAVTQTSVELSAVSSPGQSLAERLSVDTRFARPHGSMTGTTLEVGGDLQNGQFSYATGASNYTFVNNDRDIVRAKLALGIGGGHELLSTDLPERGLDKLNISTQFDATHRLGDSDTSAYLAGAFALGTRGTQEVLETGLEQYSGRLLLRAALQASKDRNAPVGTYGVLGATLYSGRFFLGATAEEPLNVQFNQSKRPTMMLSAGFNF